MRKFLVLLVLLVVGGAAGGLGAAFLAPPPAAEAHGAPGAPPAGVGHTPTAAAPEAEGDGAGEDAAGAHRAAGGPADGPAASAAVTRHAPGDASGQRSFVTVGRQLIVPIVHGQTTRALILFELAIDVPSELSDAAQRMQPRLRDAFLRELFAMSYTGAFDETYTDARVIEEMRRNLRVVARTILGDKVADVLVLDVMRQEL
ncbi:MAG: flagellar basal body-associated FliL family protein [Thermohalobaculum sp.]|nr:flagellar basal body-associated FliL family protein [Thermohalobaculum sp.]